MKLPLAIAAIMHFALASAASAQEFLQPVKIKEGREPIDVQRQGHAAPFVGDFNDDGLVDLLVGEFHEGRMRIYLNQGNNAQPRFGEHKWLYADNQLAGVPTG